MTDARMAETIRSMTDELAPVVPILPLRLRVAMWGALCALVAVAVVGLVGVRRDIARAIVSAEVWAQLLAMIGLAAVAAVAALRLAVPGQDHSADRVWAFRILAAWPCVVLVWFLSDGGSADALMAEPLHPTCMRTIGIAAAMPAVVLAVMIRRGLPLRPRWAATMAGMAAAGVGAVTVALTCPLASLSHVLIAHTLPTVALAAVAAAAMLPWLRRRLVPRL